MPNLHLLTQTFSQARHASGTDQFNGLGPPLTQKRPAVAALRRIRITRRQPFMANMLTRMGFIDETSIKTDMAKTTGRAPRGERLVDHAPFVSVRSDRTAAG